MQKKGEKNKQENEGDYVGLRMCWLASHLDAADHEGRVGP